MSHPLLQEPYYAVGLGGVGVGTCGPDGTSNCSFYGWHNDGTADNARACASVTPWQGSIWFPANASVSHSPVCAGLPSGQCADIRWLPGMGGVYVSQNVFTAGAAGWISSSASQEDGWVINNNKDLANTQDGI